jgi:hypothetical protein
VANWDVDLLKRTVAHLSESIFHCPDIESFCDAEVIVISCLLPPGQLAKVVVNRREHEHVAIEGRLLQDGRLGREWLYAAFDQCTYNFLFDRADAALEPRFDLEHIAFAPLVHDVPVHLPNLPVHLEVVEQFIDAGALWVHDGGERFAVALVPHSLFTVRVPLRLQVQEYRSRAVLRAPQDLGQPPTPSLPVFPQH